MEDILRPQVFVGTSWARQAEDVCSDRTAWLFNRWAAATKNADGREFHGLRHLPLQDASMSAGERSDLKRVWQLRSGRAGLTTDQPKSKSSGEHPTHCPRCKNINCADTLEHAFLDCPAMDQQRADLFESLNEAWSWRGYKRFLKLNPRSKMNMLLRAASVEQRTNLAVFHRGLIRLQIACLTYDGRTDEVDRVRKFHHKPLEY
jgi:hypothetical protein